MKIHNVHVSTRVMVAFISLVTLATALAAYSIFNMERLGGKLAEINDFNSVKQRYAINFRGSVHDRAISVRDVVLFENQAGLDKALEEIKVLEAAYEKSAIALDKMFETLSGITANERTILASIKEIERITTPLYKKVVDLHMSGEKVAARKLLMEEASPNFSEWLRRINQFIDLQEAINKAITQRVNGSIQQFDAIVLGILLFGGTLSLIMGIWCASAVRRLTPLASAMKLVAEGDINADIPTLKGKNEVAEMASALHFFQESLQRSQSIEAENEQQASRAEADKKQAMQDLADHFEANVENIVTGVSQASERMVSLASTLIASAGSASDRSSAVALSSQETTQNVQTIATASEEMTSSLAEVSARVGKAAEMTDGAARKTEQTTQTVSKLSTSAQTIGDVISLISDIAEQTNLLALNATIEAARAGEAGKGFAVVASEVKGLASQTAKATEQISDQITKMQSDTGAVVNAIGEIGKMIQDLNGTSTSLASAVQQQHSATQEIALNTQNAAKGTQHVTSNIADVSSTISETDQAANEVMDASSKLASEAKRMRESVKEFLETVRAA